MMSIGMYVRSLLRGRLARAEARRNRKLGPHVEDKYPDDEPLAEQRLSLSRRKPLMFRPLTPSDILAFHALRLEALRLHPESFVPTYDEERSIDPAAIAPRFRDDWISGGNFILGAYVFGWLVGAVGVRRWSRHKQRHKATLWLLFTHAAVRGQGIGRQLLEQAIDRCRRDPDLELLQLTVSGESDVARELYVSAGFQSYGIEQQALKLGDRYIDVELMAIPLA